MSLMSIGHWRGCASAGLPHERRIEFRVGIHLGDVIEKSEGDPMGDGVNSRRGSKHRGSSWNLSPSRTIWLL